MPMTLLRLRRLPRLLPTLLLLSLLSSCTKPTFDVARLEESVREICRKEYDFNATARLVGKTLYADIAPQNLVGLDLGLNQKTVERLYDTLLTVTRVALSSNADVDFLVVRAKDTNTGSVITILRYAPDVKWYFYMRISRADFQGRGVMEIDRSSEKDVKMDYHEVTLTEFMARLAASKLQQKITYNPLVSVFVRVHRITGTVDDGVMTLLLGKTTGFTFEKKSDGEEGTTVPGQETEGEEDDSGALVDEEENSPTDAFLRRSFIKVAGDVLNRYDEDKVVQRVRVVEEGGRVVFDFEREDLLEARRKLPKATKWIPDEDY